MIYLGKTANTILQKNLKNRNYNRCRGYFLDRKVWIAFDNTNGNCWVEEFASEGMAICWLEHFYEISEIDEFEVLKLNKDLFFIPKNGFLNIQFQKDLVTSKFYPFGIN